MKQGLIVYCNTRYLGDNTLPHENCMFNEWKHLTLKSKARVIYAPQAHKLVLPTSLAHLSTLQIAIRKEVRREGRGRKCAMLPIFKKTKEISPSAFWLVWLLLFLISYSVSGHRIKSLLFLAITYLLRYHTLSYG